MTTSTKKQPSLDLISNEATRHRWTWVHQAISSAKHRNASTLYDTEVKAISSIRPPVQVEF